jgi:MutS-like protein
LALEHQREEEAVIDRYSKRAATHAARRDEEQRRSVRLSRMRLATVLPGLAFLLWALTHGGAGVPLAVGVGLLAAFAVLVGYHARVEERAAAHEARRVVNTRALARIERRWDELPAADAPATIDLAHHAYALDLDLFGRASLFQWLGPAATPSGGARLASWLLTAAEPPQILARQAAVVELAALDEWREELAARGILAAGARQVEIDAFLAWAAAGPDSSRAMRTAVVGLMLSIWVLAGLDIAGLVAGSYWLIPLLIGVVWSFVMGNAIHTAFERAGAGQDALGRYAALFEHATGPTFKTDLLRDAHERLSAEGRSAPDCMRRFNRIMGFAALRYSAALLHLPIQAFTLWDFHVLFALDRWRAHTGSRVRGWFDALGDLDALSALGGVRFDNPAWCMPEIDARPAFVARELAHPLIPDDRRVSNDVEVGPPGTMLLVTGSNMSGKSTLLRAIGLNAVLAQAGSCTCASALRLPPTDLQTSVRVQDSLELGLSYFMAALARLKAVVDAAERPRPGRILLYLLDEILQGTNSAERGIAVRAVARHLLDAGAIGAMTTHDLNVAREDPLDTSARLVHFTETVGDDGGMRFDYRLREGIATSRNALRLMQLIGIDLR